MAGYDLKPLLQPRSVALVGASNNFGKPGGRTLSFLINFGYSGKIFPINPTLSQAQGLTCYPSLGDLPEAPDLVVILAPAAAVPELVGQCGQIGAGAAIICSSGFAEAGAAGAELQRQLIEASATAGIPIIGPNSLGILNLHHNLTATFSTALQASEDMRPSGTAFVSQSGALGAIVFHLAREQQVGFGMFVSTGNEAVLNFNDILEYLVDDPATTLILGYVEGVRDGRRLVDAGARARRAGKTVALIKVGHSDAGRQAAQSHTGAMVGSAMVYEAAFRRAGILAVDSISGLVDLTVAQACPYPVRGPRVGIISTSGGAGVMIADRCAEKGLVVPALSEATRSRLAIYLPAFASLANPIDYGFIYGDMDASLGCVDSLMADTGIDAVILFIGLSPHFTGAIEARLAAIQAAHCKPLLVAWLGGNLQSVRELRRLGVVTYGEITPAVEALDALRRAAEPIELPIYQGDGARAARMCDHLKGVAIAGASTLSERQTKELLAAYGIPVTRDILAQTQEQAIAAARHLKGPLAVKVEAMGLLHKSDAGAVALNVLAEDAGHAWDRVVKAASDVVGRENVRGAIIQPMAARGLELIAGIRYDPQFGPTISVGLGGLLSEVLMDITTEIAPINHRIAREMLGRLKGARLLGAFRGALKRDVNAVCDLLVHLGEFAMDAGELVQELDLNPVIVRPVGEGCLVVDAAAVLGLPHAH